MTEPLNLKEIEKKAWRSTFEDGLWDIYLGSLFFIMGVSPLLRIHKVKVSGMILKAGEK